jgi:hypothetical protein
MKDRYIVDTNVLIAASAADPHHPADIDAIPTDPGLRRSVWEWLTKFESSNCRLVLDSEQKIFEEYNNKLSYQDYGIQVIMKKFSQCAFDIVDVAYDQDGHGVLPEPLALVIHDLADRKMVATALAALTDFGNACIAFAGDTDWHDWEQELDTYQIMLEPIIEDWSRAKHAEKLARR